MTGQTACKMVMVYKSVDERERESKERKKEVKAERGMRKGHWETKAKEREERGLG